MPTMINGKSAPTVAPALIILLVLFIAPYAVIAAEPRPSTHPSNESRLLVDIFVGCFTLHQRETALNASSSLLRSHNGDVIYIPVDGESSSSFDKVYTSSINNGLYVNSTAGRPIPIVAASNDSHVRAAVICGRKSGLRLRVRSGGHDFEGLSYREVDDGNYFFLLDLGRMRSITVDAQRREAWVEAGATLGELYYSISKASPTLGFPAGFFPTVGVGGHISGGGVGMLLRKYGLAADNVLDARVVDVRGCVLDRKSMGEGLFWALRGGGGASFGVVLAFRIRLVAVTPTVTVFSVSRNRSQGAVGLLTRWQHVAYQLPMDLNLGAVIQTADDPSLTSDRAVDVTFRSLFLGKKKQLLSVVHQYFPELGLTEADCTEMSYVESVHFHAGYAGRPLTDILDRTPQMGTPFKGKYDFVNKPISQEDWEGIFSQLQQGKGFRIMELDPYGGRMYEIPESAIPFPHRKGIVFRILYIWSDDDAELAASTLRKFFQYMTPFVSMEPRGAYINAKDLDLGRNRLVGKATYEEAIAWGSKYFKANFQRLAVIKGKVDPENYFWNEQSIPSLSPIQWTFFIPDHSACLIPTTGRTEPFVV